MQLHVHPARLVVLKEFALIAVLAIQKAVNLLTNKSCAYVLSDQQALIVLAPLINTLIALFLTVRNAMTNAQVVKKIRYVLNALKLIQSLTSQEVVNAKSVILMFQL
jgi:hypothetical protein